MYEFFRMVITVFFITGIPTQAIATTPPSQKAPEFFLPEIYTDEQVSLRQFRGQVVYLDFWASWCGPCRQSLPAMETLYNKYKSRGFVVVTVNLDDDKQLGQGFLNQLQLSYRTLYDPEQKLPSLYQVEAMPTSFLIDREGIIRLEHKGFRESDLAQLEAQIQRWIEEPLL